MNGHTLFLFSPRITRIARFYNQITLSGLKIRAIRVIRGEKLLVVL